MDRDRFTEPRYRYDVKCDRCGEDLGEQWSDYRLDADDLYELCPECQTKSEELSEDEDD